MYAMKRMNMFCHKERKEHKAFVSFVVFVARQ